MLHREKHSKVKPSRAIELPDRPSHNALKRKPEQSHFIKTPMFQKHSTPNRHSPWYPRLLRRRRVLRDGLGAFGHSMFCQLTREDQSYTGERVNKMRRILRMELEIDIRCLDFAGGDRGLLVVCGKFGSLGCDALEDIWIAC